MKRLNQIILGGVLQIIICSTVRGQFASLTTGTASVTEGTSLDVTCTLTAMNPTSDTSCNIVITAASTPTVELGLDLPDVTQYSCVVPATQTMATISIPTFADSIMEASETIDLDCSTPVTGATVVFTLTDDGAGSLAEARLTNSFYSVEEAGATITYTVEFFDSNGNQVNAEEDFSGVNLVLPNAASDTAVDGMDFDLTTLVTAIEPVSAMLNMDGTAVYQYTITHDITEDDVLENLEEFSVQLSYTGTLITASSEVATVWIQDNDLPAAYALSDRSPLSRRSKQDVNIVVFTKSGNNGLTMTSVPYTPKDCFETSLPVFNGIEYSFAKPSRRSRTRFNEYLFTTTETIGIPTPLSYSLTTSIDISATSHRGRRAPIETSAGQTITVYPSLDGCTDDALSSPVEIAAPYASSFSDQLRWFFYPANDPTREIRRRPYNGKSSFFISKCSEVGIYRLCRRRRCSRGWYDFVRVIQAACPVGFQYPATPDGTCGDPAAFVCINGGTFDGSNRVCICPPGFAGQTCEIALTPGQFGSSAEFTIDSFFPGNNRGKGIRVCSNDPGGCSCFAGFYGNDCMKACPPGMFGADCTFTCHCNDDHCDPFNGVCENGCAPGFSGTNCQI